MSERNPSHQARLEFDLVTTQEHLDFYKGKFAKDPNPVFHKWVEIYTDRLSKLKQQLGSH